MRYFIEVSYNGTHFHGSQLQGAIPTVQLALNNAISTILRLPVSTFGASRTDEGVHALSNFYHFDLQAPLHPQFLYKVNAVLPPGIAVKQVYEAKHEEANARFDAISRTYRYRIYNKKDPFLHQRALYYPFKINMDVLQETAAILMRYEDFETFSKRNTQTHTFKCKLLQSEWKQQQGELQYIVTANRFLRGMVRGLVGTQLQVARGRITVADFISIIESQDCTLADFSVAGHGLYLEAISYPEDLLLPRPDIK